MGEAQKMRETRTPGSKLTYFVVGLALPIVGWSLCALFGKLRCESQKEHVDKAHDVTVEDSFPASDPPSAW